MTRPLHTRRRFALSLLLLFSLSNLFGCEGEEPPPTGVFLTVTSTTALDSLLIKARNLAYDTSVQQIDLGNRDLLTDSFTLALEPSEALDGEFLIYIQGFRGDQRVAGASLMADFRDANFIELELRLTEGFQDDDGDGFEPCLSGEYCDCSDSIAEVNPFTEELCETPYDDNCSGFANEGCACTADADCTILPDELRHLAGIGACTLGTLACEDGVLSQECVGAGTLSAEVADNGIDDDCDGHVDEGSPCSELGTVRPCFLGLINSDALARAVGTCGAGEQRCEDSGGAGGLWGDCTNETRPTFEQAPLDWRELGDECDGLDNDCDGIVDDEAFFDADQDGYTACGTCLLRVGDLDHTCDECGRDQLSAEDPRLCAAFIDCADNDPDVHPFNREVCGNDIDEDCRCDHDENGNQSTVGLPVIELDGTSNCVATDQFLSCTRPLRSDPNPSGICSDSTVASGPYYYGYRGNDSDNCYFCGDRFGESCVPDGAGCSTKDTDCASCSTWDEQVAPVVRPGCAEPGEGGCIGQDAPVWELVVSGDPYGDCGSVSCGGYYWGISGSECFERRDQEAAEVDCMASPDASRCQGAEELCPLEVEATGSPVFRDLCMKAVDGCTGTVPPIFAAQANNEDLFSECNAVYTCVSDLNDGGGPFYFGIEDDSADGQDNGACYLRANVQSSSCNGTGGCQNRAEACSTAPRGVVQSGRPVCQRPSGGCEGTDAPSFTNVEFYSDPYAECGGNEGCCISSGDQGMCCLSRGQSCQSTSECASGLHCVDGVCCDGLCNSPCQSCLAADNVAQLDGVCSNIKLVQEDTSPVALCTDSAGGCGGDTGCMCEAETGNCKRAKGSTCSSDTNCASGQCECADANCTVKRCSEVDCERCKYNNDGNQTCEGNIADNVDDADDSCGTLTCNGLADCNKDDDADCSLNQECLSNFCIIGTCGPASNSGESCDEDADCLAPNVCNTDQICRVPGIVVASNPEGLLTTEAEDTDLFALVLSSKPDSNVTFELESTDTSEATVSPTSLTFTANNWQTPQSVEVTGVDDEAVDGSIGYTIVTKPASSSDDNYQGLNGPDVSGTNVDNDVAGVTVSPTEGLVTSEAGTQQTFSVVLNTLPTHPVSVSIETSDDSEVTVSPGLLVFSVSSWNAPQSVTVMGVNDWVDDDDQEVIVSVKPAASSDTNYDGIDPSDVTVTNQDDDESGISVSPVSGLTTTEGGGTAQFSLVLTSQPSADVSVSLTSSDPSEGSVSATSVTFSQSNWSAVKTIIVTGADDDVDDGDQPYTVVTSGVSSADVRYAALNPNDVALTNTDDDTAAIIVSQTSGHELSEAGATSSFTVVLATEPLHEVAITLSTNDSDEVSLSTSVLRFNGDDWNTPQTVTLIGEDDLIDDGDRAFTVILAAAVSVDAAYSGMNVDNVSGTNEDNDNAGLMLNDSSGLVTSEDGGQDSFTVKLATQPTASVEVEVEVSNTLEATANKSSLTFTVSNWDTPQEISVTGVDDDVDDDDVSYTVELKVAASSDGNYSGLSPSLLTGSNQDDDTAGITVIGASSLSTSETGTTASFQVELDSEPLNTVSISLDSNDLGEVSVINPASGALSFNSSNWSDSQTVTLSGVDDTVSDGDRSVSVSLGPAESDDGKYSGLSIPSLTVTNVDDDPLPEVAIESSASIDEGNANNTTVTLGVSLDRASSSTITVDFETANTTASDGNDYSAVIGTLTFDPGDLSQSLNISVLGDYVDESDETFRVILSNVSASATLDAGASASTVTIVDNDETPSITEATTSTALLSQESTEAMTVSCSFTDTDGHNRSRFDIDLGVRDESGVVTMLCASASHNDPCSNGAATLSVTKDGTSYVASVSWDPSSALPDGTYDLSCSVTDRGGNIDSADYDSSEEVFELDGTSPAAPTVTGTSPTSDATPTWNWTSGGDGNGIYRYKLDDSALSSGATETSNVSYTPSSNLSDGAHTLYVQERDAAGNWSSSGSSTIIVDATAPTIQGVSSTGGTYVATNVVTIIVTFDEAITVSGGVPSLALNTTPERTATFVSASATQMTFEYTVMAGDTAGLLDYTAASALQLNGATIKDAVGNDADLTLAAPGGSGSLSESNVVVDGD